MIRYETTIGIALVAVVLTAMLTVLPRLDGEPSVVPMSVFWTIAGAASAYILLGVWGIIGIKLSLLKERTTEFAAQDVIVSRRSWHYRFNTWINYGKQPSKACSECEYWARLFHGLSLMPPVYVALVILFLLYAVIGWFFSARRDFVSGVRTLNIEKLFKQGHQPIGPIVFLLMVAAGLTLSGAGSAIAHAPWPTIGIWSGGIIGGIIGVVAVIVVIVLIAREALHAAQPFFSATGARIIGVCRPIRFVD